MDENADDRPFALCCDDDPLVRMAAADILEDAGFQPIEADGAQQALELLAAQGSEIVLLFTDVHMPPGPLNGFDLARECAKGWPHIGILVASGQAKPEPGDLPEGASFISKPFSADVVHGHLIEILPNDQKPERLRRKQAF